MAVQRPPAPETSNSVGNARAAEHAALLGEAGGPTLPPGTRLASTPAPLPT